MPHAELSGGHCLSELSDVCPFGNIVGRFREAQQKKLIQPESNFELAFMFFENTLLYALFAPYEEPKRALTYSNAVLTYLAGVCTAEGRKVLHCMAASGELQPAG